ncbi:hypothetical protein ACS0TY_007238 [Phlomoides rotata]
MEKLENRIGCELWTKNDFDWAWSEAEDRSGGLISIWNMNVFVKTSLWDNKEMLVVNGRWLEDNGEMVIINVYAPCSFNEKAQLWDTINLVIEQNEDARICVVGDFNPIREKSERIGK